MKFWLKFSTFTTQVLDVAKLSSESWELTCISKETVCRCSVKSKMLPLHMAKDLEGVYGKLRKGTEPRVEKVSNMLSTRSIFENFLHVRRYYVTSGLIFLLRIKLVEGHR